MNESQLIDQLNAALDDEAATVRVPAGTAERARKQAHRRRLARGLAATVPVAGLAAGLAVAASGQHAPAARQSGLRAGAVKTARLTAAEVLDRAAASALAQPAVVPRPGQFIYWKTVDSVYGTAETWRSADGSRNGFVLSRGQKVMLWGCSGGWQTVQPDPGSGLKPVTQRCLVQPAYLPDMPVNAGAMQAYLARNFGSGVHDAAVAQKLTEVLLAQDYLLPAQRAALYRFFVTTPGLQVIPLVRDYAGRPGIGVRLTTDGFSATWIFDPHTFAYLGSTATADGKVSSGLAVLKVAVVDKAGQRT